MSEPLRVLFLNEGGLGTGILGHARVGAAIEAGLAGDPRIAPRFRTLPPMGRPALLAAGLVPLLGRFDLDLQVARWHAVQAASARRVVRGELAAGDFDRIHVNSHSIALALVSEMRRIPTALSVDATVWDFRALAVWARLRRHSRATMAPSMLAERRAFAAARLILAWTGWALRGVERACPGAKVVEHHPGLDLSRFAPAPRPPRERLRVLFVASRFEGKGGHDLLWAIEPMLGRDLELDVVTNSTVSEREGLRVHGLLEDEELIDLYQQADIFCLPTYADSASWVLLEAMACGAAVISTDVGGTPDLLDHGKAGVLVRPADRAGLRTALRELTVDDSRREELSARARHRCEERYDARRQSAELADLLEAMA